MSTYYDKCFDRLINHEGGFTADRRDKGNWTGGVVGKGELKGTKFGIAASSYGHLDIKNLTVADAKAIYAKDYWHRSSCDLLPKGVAFLVFDASVNHGVKQSIKFLQRSVGAVEDGVIGPKTLLLINKMPNERIITEFSYHRMIFYTEISTFNLYKKGWTRRAIECQATALKDVK